MKGEKTIKIDGRDLKLRLDLNAIVDFCEDCGIDDFSQFDKALNKPANIRSFVKYLAKSGGNQIDDNVAGKLELSQMQDVLSLVGDSGEAPGARPPKSKK